MASRCLNDRRNKSSSCSGIAQDFDGSLVIGRDGVAHTSILKHLSRTFRLAICGHLSPQRAIADATNAVVNA